MQYYLGGQTYRSRRRCRVSWSAESEEFFEREEIDLISCIDGLGVEHRKSCVRLEMRA